jgi:hypothetical protein
MFLSKLSSDVTKEFQRVTRQRHIDGVWAEIEKNLDTYWAGMVASEAQVNPVAALAANPNFKVTTKAAPHQDLASVQAKALRERFASAIAAYEKEAEAYRTFLDEESLEEYADAPDSFKTDFRSKLPIIRYCLNSKVEVMKKWQMEFKLVKSADYLALMENLLDWSDQFREQWPEADFAAAEDWAALHKCGLDDDSFESSEEYVVAGVVGYGIRACILHHLDAQYFPYFGRTGSLALFFLSGGNKVGRLHDSEFLIIDDVYTGDASKKMDHNYWYPFSLFTLYCLKTFRALQTRAAAIGVTLEPEHRFVYVSSFFDEITRKHEEAIQTMLTYDDIEKKGMRRW